MNLGSGRTPLRISIVIVGLLSGCSSLPIKLYGFTELVMKPGEAVVAQTASGAIKITADDELSRTYSWADSSRSA